MKSYLCNPNLFQGKNTPNILHVYTGDGKGKTTAALGVALRSLGKGKKVAVVQFLKQLDGAGDWEFYQRYFKERSELQWQRFGRKEFLDPKYPLPEDFSEVQKGLAAIRNYSKECNLIIADELNVALSYGLCSREDVDQIISTVLQNAHMIMTGRGMPAWLRDRADLITQMKMMKHPYEQGMPVIPGLDY